MQLMDDIEIRNTNVEVEVDVLKKLIDEADNIFEFTETMVREDEEGYDVDEELQKLVDKYRKEARIIPLTGMPTQKTPEND
jgi:hypothetical protein